MGNIRLYLNENEVVKDYRNLKSIKRVALKHGCSAGHIRLLLLSLGIDTSINRVKPKQFLISDAEIKARYLSGESLSDIAKDAQVTKGLMCLRKKLQDLGVDTSKNMKRYSLKISKASKIYTVNETVFNKLDSEEKNLLVRVLDGRWI